MHNRFRKDNSGGAAVKYAIFLCIASVLFVSSIAYLGNQYRPQIAAWHQGVEIDNRAVGSITPAGSIVKKQKGAEDEPTYRIYKLPPGLQPKQ